MNALAPAALDGFLTSLVLILAIGAQNAFVLKQGILRQHVFWVVLTCALSDAILIGAGVAGFGVVVTATPMLPRIMSIAGAVFLTGYAFSRFYAAYKGGAHQDISAAETRLGRTILTTLALTWLNPHVYLDTLGLLGAVSTRYETIPVKFAFAIGAIAASFLFFFSLGYAARFIAPLARRPQTWRILDIGIGCVMLYLAIKLARGM